MAKAYLINPFDETITEVDYTGDYRNIYTHIGADAFDIVRCRDRIDLFVDDEGLLKDGQAFFIHADYPTPLAGKALVLSNDGEGNSIAPEHLSLDDLYAKVAWAYPRRAANGEVHVMAIPAVALRAPH